MSPSGYYLDLELSLEEQREMLESFYEEIRSEPGRQGSPSPSSAGAGMDQAPTLVPYKGSAQVSAAETLHLFPGPWVTSYSPRGLCQGNPKPDQCYLLSRVRGGVLPHT